MMNKPHPLSIQHQAKKNNKKKILIQCFYQDSKKLRMIEI